MLVVIRPEVIAIEDDTRRRARIRSWLRASRAYRILEVNDDEIIVAVVSGKGDASQELAEKLHQELDPELVQSRLLRLMPKRKR